MEYIEWKMLSGLLQNSVSMFKIILYPVFLIREEVINRQNVEEVKAEPESKKNICIKLIKQYIDQKSM